MGLENAETKEFLDQQPPSARRHGCATTTTHATTGPVLLVLSEQHLRDPKTLRYRMAKFGFKLLLPGSSEARR
jgi:hypothetical protein